MEEKDQEIKKRLKELSNKSYKQNIFTFSNFINQQELSCLDDMDEFKGISYKCFGGSSYCERVIVRFGDPEELGYEVDFPITIIKISPVAKKFSEELSHRDFLGTIMGLGIERHTIGDILVRDNEAYIFVLSSIADYIMENMTRVKHTTIKLSIINDCPEIEPKLIDKDIIVSSRRLDALVSATYNLSRNQSFEAISGGLVCVNGHITDNTSKEIKDNDILTVRGKGKFRVKENKYVSKKGKLCITIEVFA